MFTIRKAVAGDEAEILRLITELAIYEKMEDEVINTEAMLHEELFGSNAIINAFIAEFSADGQDEKKVVGFALYFFNYSTFVGKKGLYLEDLYVEPEFRGKGLGKGLFVRLAEEAVAQNCGRFEWQVLDWNKPSIDFYKAMGAISMDGWTTFRLHDQSLHDLATQAKG